MGTYAFGANSQDKLNRLITQFENYDDTDVSAALDLSIQAWHMVDWYLKSSGKHIGSLMLDFSEKRYIHGVLHLR